MKLGISRFNYYLDQLERLMDLAAKNHNPALFLYKKDTRTITFMLEGLSRVYSKIHNKKRFTKFNEDFKKLEDGFGQIDYYSQFATEFKKEVAIPVTYKEYTEAQTREKIQQLNELLIERKWLGEKPERITKIRKKLESANWKDQETELKAITKYYTEEITEIKTFFKECNGSFTNTEQQVHELRRKMRWLSIYPKALQGAVQLDESATSTPTLKKYLTPEIIGSPFNVFPKQGANNPVLFLHKTPFMALSWMIAELGKIKDNSLRIDAISEAHIQISGDNQEQSIIAANKILGKKHPSQKTFLDQAYKISMQYFKEGSLDTLISGIKSSKPIR